MLYSVCVERFRESIELTGLFLASLLLCAGSISLGFLYRRVFHGPIRDVLCYGVDTVAGMGLVAGIFLMGVAVTYPFREREVFHSPDLPGGDWDFDLD